jgi:hypothetical protein
MEFNLEPGEIVNEGEGQAFQTPLPQSEGEEQGQELHAQQPRRSPRLNKVTEGEAAVKDSQASAIGSKVLEVWYHLEAKLEIKLPYHVAFETIKEWTLKERSILCLPILHQQIQTPCTTMRP